MIQRQISARNWVAAILAMCILCGANSGSMAADPKDRNRIFLRDNITAWCIVPYDGLHRGPAERAKMLERIGIRHFAYDWRAAHLPGFNQELDELAAHHIQLNGVWFPDTLNADARFILECLAKHHVKTQLWVMSVGYNQPDQAARIEAAVDRMRPIAKAADQIGCTLGLYNHGGWFGIPENQIAVLERLKAEGVHNVGIVYNFQHGYAELDRFAEMFTALRPYLLAVNLNGMSKVDTTNGEPVVPMGQGELDIRLLRTIRNSGYAGPIGIINESSEDAELRLLDNLEGLTWLLPQLDNEPAGKRPKLRTWPVSEPGTAKKAPASHLN